MELRLNIPSRVHITLIDMTGDGYRRHGGLGFSLRMGFSCSAMLAKTQEVIDLRRNSLANSLQVDELNAVARATFLKASSLEPIRFSINSGFDAHQGMGSGTALRLALLEALFELNGQPQSPTELAELSGRGGVSGIGLQSYFKGGYSVDLGVSNDLPIEIKSSDDYDTVHRRPLQLMRANFPNWQIGICVPPEQFFVSQQNERRLFASIKDVPRADVYELAYEALFGVTAAVIEADLDSFARSISRIQATYWKAAERHIHSPMLQSVETALREAGAFAIAMSSLGPTLIFVFTREIVEFNPVLPPGFQIHFTAPCNFGRSISYA